MRCRLAKRCINAMMSMFGEGRGLTSSNRCACGRCAQPAVGSIVVRALEILKGGCTQSRRDKPPQLAVMCFS